MSGENRAVAQTAEGATVFRPGRRYRLLALIQGPTTSAALSRHLYECGFARGTVGVSLPADWSKHKPADWPDEGLYGILSGQSLIRISAVFGADRPLRVDAETEIEPGALMRLLEAWDYGEAEIEAPSARSAGAASSPATHEEDRGKKVLIAAGLIGAIAVGWNWLSGRKKLEHEQERFESLAAKAEQEEIRRRVHELTNGGMNRYDALAKAEGEAEGGQGDDEHEGHRVIVIRA